MKPKLISERILELEKRLKDVMAYISNSYFQPEEEYFDRKKRLEMELYELSDRQNRGQKYL